MEDVGTNVDTPRTTSVDDSLYYSEKSTRVSTPTENRAEELSDSIDSAKPLEQDDVADDVTMKDIGPTALESDPSYWKVRKIKKDADYDSDLEKFEELPMVDENDFFEVRP